MFMSSIPNGRSLLSTTEKAFRWNYVHSSAVSVANGISRVEKRRRRRLSDELALAHH